ncbi:MAG: hypothetical protein K5872_07775 [Rhizobiaceae bacterium]|nr:hypothetical protein [Rhizobiaceae bacterium]MCV0406112.1 hypothetical protein [Rhizobiaceae bacterium]
MSDFVLALLLATIGGLTIPAGGWLASHEHIRPKWLEQEFRHSVIAFGGGALLAAVALVLVPRGVEDVPTAIALAAFAAGGLVFYVADKMLQARGGSASQLMAMVLDYLPESLALGAMLAMGEAAALLLALLIALQNLPEGFNAFREIAAANGIGNRRLLGFFCLLVLIGPAAASIGFALPASAAPLLASVMLFSAGGILYLIFEDIAPQVRLQRHQAPAMGAVAGFLVGLAGHLVIG